jgi:hypothetical protein
MKLQIMAVEVFRAMSLENAQSRHGEVVCRASNSQCRGVRHDVTCNLSRFRVANLWTEFPARNE